ncbi:unnamed protein product, partial [Mesorhabditis belari]|uniref:Uncharacterized protein n=1 Tax=Mesorhabditis belari TaxID=2138241 RepID=A0AAF3F4M2_9BILA
MLKRRNLQIDPNYENRPLKNFNSTQTKRKTADPWGDPVPSSEEDSYWCYICIDQNGHSSSPALLAHLLQKQMRVPLAPSCSLDRYAYQIMCKGPCVVAMYTRGREFLGYLRDCASAAAFKAFSEQQLSQFPQPAPQVIGLGQDIYVELSICRGDYCNTDVRQTTRRARIPKNRLDAQNDHEVRVV